MRTDALVNLTPRAAVRRPRAHFSRLAALVALLSVISAPAPGFGQENPEGDAGIEMSDLELGGRPQVDMPPAADADVEDESTPFAEAPAVGSAAAAAPFTGMQ